MTEFECIKCNYSTKSAFNFKRHINSSKHKKNICAPIDGIKKNMYVNVEKNINIILD